MAKYLKQLNGNIVEDESISTSAGAGDAGKIPELDSAGRLNANMMPSGIGADTASIVAATGGVTAGDFVNIFDNSGTPNVRVADASAGTALETHGFVLVSAAAGANVDVYFEGSNTAVTGQVAGPVFLATTPGDATATAPSASGDIVQKIGIATSATSINFEAGQSITLV